MIDASLVGEPDADERAFIDEVLGDDPVERRDHGRVVQIDLGRLDGGLGVHALPPQPGRLSTSIPAPSPGWRNRCCPSVAWR